MPLTPKNRKEEWLEGLVEHSTTLTPKNRPEEWMLGLIEGTTTLTPKNRCEAWMKEIIDASGGGGGGGMDLILDDSIGAYSTTSTSQVDTGFTFTVQDALDYEVLLIIFKDSEQKTDHFYSELNAIYLYNNNNGDWIEAKSAAAAPTEKFIVRDKTGTLTSTYTSSIYGIFPLNSTITITGNNVRFGVSARYSSLYTGTIDGNFSIKVYGIKLSSIMG